MSCCIARYLGLKLPPQYILSFFAEGARDLKSDRTVPTDFKVIRPSPLRMRSSDHLVLGWQIQLTKMFLIYVFKNGIKETHEKINKDRIWDAIKKTLGIQVFVESKFDTRKAHCLLALRAPLTTTFTSTVLARNIARYLEWSVHHPRSLHEYGFVIPHGTISLLLGFLVRWIWCSVEHHSCHG